MTEVRSAVLVSVVGPARPGLTQAGLVGGVKDITQRSSSGKVSLPSWVDVRRGSGTGSGPGPELGRVPEMRGERGGLGSEAASQADGGWRMEHRGRVGMSVAWFSVSPLRGGEHPINIDPPGSVE